MAAIDGVGSLGRAVVQREYLNDQDNTDEWGLYRHIDIGISTDNYVDGCINGTRGSYHYANTFYDSLFASFTDPLFTLTHHYNNLYTRNSSINDFSVNGAISNNIDFMIYIGHGHAAHNAYGNHLHYDCAGEGVCHTSNEAKDTLYGIYTSDVRFGSSQSDLRWVWLYTCNFLTTNDYVTEESLKSMMTGAHIVMGYASQSYLCDAMVEKFAEYLLDGETIIEAYFKAGRNGEATETDDNHLQRVLYIPQAFQETIYSPQVHYDYEASDVLIISSYIHGDTN